MPPRIVSLCITIVVSTVFIPSASSAETQVPEPLPEQLADMKMEELLGATVTSVARREEQLAQSPAAVRVITNEEIRRSGATTIPELLRTVPGLQVAKVDSHDWAISSRGFNDVFANKLLVLIDGRSVYTPLFSGVYWEAQDLILEDVERVEVIRGPGASLWGSNAVNGVINVITKRAASTQGTLITGHGGTEDRAGGSIRYGGKVGDDFHFRIFGKYAAYDDSVLTTGERADDAWNVNRFGFRSDWNVTGNDLLTFQGDLYQERLHEAYDRIRPTSPYDSYVDHTLDHVSGGDLLARLTHTFSPSSEFVLQAYYDHTKRNVAPVNETRDTFDVDFQQRFSLGERQTVVLGGGYRRTTDEIGNTFDVSFLPDHRTTDLLSAFLQDEIVLIKNRLSLTLGTKVEHNDYTGTEWQPNGRIVWTPDDRQSIWASVSRAVRTPSRAEDDVVLRSQPVLPPGALYAGFPPYVPPSPGIVTTLRGRRNFDSEKLIAYETGYRVKVNDRVSLDLATFYNDYDDLRSVTANTPAVDFTKSPAELSFIGGNAMHGQTYGGEISANLRINDWWRMRADYTLLKMDLHVDGKDANTTQFGDRGVEKSSPQNQFQIHSWLDLPRRFEFDTTLRYVDSLPSVDVPAYLTVDIRVGWRPNKNLEFSIVGQNLLDNAHRESSPSFVGTQAGQVERSVYGKVTLRF